MNEYFRYISSAGMRGAHTARNEKTYTCAGEGADGGGGAGRKHEVQAVAGGVVAVCCSEREEGGRGHARRPAGKGRRRSRWVSHSSLHAHSWRAVRLFISADVIAQTCRVRAHGGVPSGRESVSSEERDDGKVDFEGVCELVDCGCGVGCEGGDELGAREFGPAEIMKRRNSGGRTTHQPRPRARHREKMGGITVPWRSTTGISRCLGMVLAMRTVQFSGAILAAQAPIRMLLFPRRCAKLRPLGISRWMSVAWNEFMYAAGNIVLFAPPVPATG
ncbi:hypothetical protein C8R45DRAFT_1081521, partial [Mycena sanguinolenta]